jgi:hypothetical protein
VGGITALTSVTTDAGGTVALNGGTVNTTGAQTYDDAMTLGQPTALTSGGAVTFASKIDGPGSLSTHALGTTTLGGAIGSTTPLGSLTTQGPGALVVSSPSIQTTGALNLAGDVTVSGPVAVQAGSSVTIHDNISGASMLAISAGGAIDLGPSQSTSSYSTLLIETAYAAPVTQAIERLVPVAPVLDDGARSQQFGLGNLQLIDLTSANQVNEGGRGGLKQVSEGDVDAAVSKISSVVDTNAMTYVVMVNGGVRLVEKAEEGR